MRVSVGDVELEVHDRGEGRPLVALHGGPGLDGSVFEPEQLRAQVTASWEREATVQTAEECKRLMGDQLPFHVAEPEGPLVEWLIENDHVVYRPEVLRHFATGGEYGLTDLRSELQTFSKPLLVLSGALDRTTPAVAAQELVDAIPVAEHVVIDDCAQMIPYEQPEAFLGALRAFLARV